MKDWGKLIAKGESVKLEFKSTLRVDLKTNTPEKFIELNCLKTLAAFFNSNGGTLLIGVEDNKNILGLGKDFHSFNKPDKLDEFQKHFDNLIQKTLGDRFQRYLKFEFPEVDGKIICAVTNKSLVTSWIFAVNSPSGAINIKDNLLPLMVDRSLIICFIPLLPLQKKAFSLHL